MTADIIRTLNVTQHPEGGWYAETYRDGAPAGGRGRRAGALPRGPYRQRPPAHLTEQHCSGVVQAEFTPRHVIAVQRPLGHWPEQHCAPVVQLAFVDRQVPRHWPS